MKLLEKFWSCRRHREENRLLLLETFSKTPFDRSVSEFFKLSEVNPLAVRLLQFLRPANQFSGSNMSFILIYLRMELYDNQIPFRKRMIHFNKHASMADILNQSFEVFPVAFVHMLNLCAEINMRSHSRISSLLIFFLLGIFPTPIEHSFNKIFIRIALMINTLISVVQRECTKFNQKK